MRRGALARFMDDNAVYDRPFDHRASVLLGRLNTHGSVKTISLRIGIDAQYIEEQKGVIPPHLIGWERLRKRNREVRSSKKKGGYGLRGRHEQQRNCYQSVRFCISFFHSSGVILSSHRCRLQLVWTQSLSCSSAHPSNQSARRHSAVRPDHEKRLGA